MSEKTFPDRRETEFFIRRYTKFFFDEKFNGDLALANWRTVYLQRNCNEVFSEFNRNFLTTVEKNALTEKKLSSNINKTTSDKLWLTKEIKQLFGEKHRYFNDYKMTQSFKSFLSFKKVLQTRKSKRNYKKNIQRFF